ncbi:hypothetical protein FNV43_RR00181 [Rhamnella rubrinervis]|uniref:Uncharacterized protein n=1 Tax=Rhamnella rubrinervis TaxID=2594499 RepID=A0A8K0HPV9_9ROSA|nr:hypothetical protein FNV43_RR00181 [Rhamnella rubrinervis]
MILKKHDHMPRRKKAGGSGWGRGWILATWYALVREAKALGLVRDGLDRVVLCDHKPLVLWLNGGNMLYLKSSVGLAFHTDTSSDYDNWEMTYRKAKNCSNWTLCEEHLNFILPTKPLFLLRLFLTCAIVENSRDLLKTQFGKEIDSHDVGIRDNEALVNEMLADNADDANILVY